MDSGSNRKVLGVAIQGRGGGAGNHWVKSFKVSVSYSSTSGYNWVDGGRTFAGNTGNGEVIVRANFYSVVTVRYVRIHPTTWDQYPMMRCGVYLEIARWWSDPSSSRHHPQVGLGSCSTLSRS